MKKEFFRLLFSGCFLFLLFCGCGKKEAVKTEKLLVVCGLPPIAGVAEAVGGESVTVLCLLPEGRTPHDYSPRPSEIREACRGKVFFTTGMTFENTLAAALRKVMPVSDVSCSIVRRELEEGNGDHHNEDKDPKEGHHEDHHDADAMDPHLWLSHANASVIAGNIAEELCRLDPVHEAEYRKNCAALQKKLAAAAEKMRSRLAPYRGETFFVYHPSFGYFADAAQLHQLSIEINGREATAKQLAEVIREAKKHQVRVIFVQPQFNPASARALADQIQGEVIPLDPLARDLPGNLDKITEALVRGWEGNGK